MLAEVLNLTEGDEFPTLTLLFSDGDTPLDLSGYDEVTVTVKSRAGYLVHAQPMTVRPDQADGSPDRGKADYEWADGMIVIAGRYWVQATCRRDALDRTFPSADSTTTGNPHLTIDVAERL